MRRETGSSLVFRLVGPLTAWAAMGFAAVLPAEEAEVIPVAMGFADHKAVSDDLEENVRRVVERHLEFRSAAEVDWTTMPAEWGKLAGEQLVSVTPGMCRQLKLDRGIQGLVLRVGYVAGTYRLNCAVFHREFDDVIVSRMVEVVDRQLVVNNIGRLVQRAWRTTGQVDRAVGGDLLVSLAGAGDLPRRGTPLEVVRVIETRKGRRRAVWANRFLAVGETRGPLTVVAGVVQPGDRLPAFFSLVGRAQVRYHVRCMKPRRGPTRIQVVSDSDGRAREACGVYVSQKRPPKSFPVGRPAGLTDEAGFFTVPFQEPGFRYVTVVCGLRYSTRTVASGQPGVTIVEMPRRSLVNRSRPARRRIIRRVREADEWVSAVIKLANVAVDRSDEASLERIVRTLKRDPGWQQFRRAIESLRKTVLRDGHRGLADDLQADLERLAVSRSDWTAANGTIGANLVKVKVARLEQQYEEARGQAGPSSDPTWSKAVAALEGLVEIDPKPESAKVLLARLRRVLGDVRPQHDLARRQVRKHIQAESAAAVLATWKDLEKSVRLLVGEKDGPELRALLDPPPRGMPRGRRPAVGLNKLSMLLTEEGEKIRKRVEADGDDMDEDELQGLKRRLEEVVAALQGLRAIEKDSEKVVKGFFSVAEDG